MARRTRATSSGWIWSSKRLFSPVTGEVVEVNKRLEKEPQLVNSSPYEDAWMVKVKMSDPSEKKELLSADDYSAHIGQ